MSPSYAGAPTTSAPADSGYFQAGGSSFLGHALTAPVSGRLQRFFGVSRIKIDPQLSGVDNTPETHVTIEQLFDGAWLPRSNRYDIPTLLLGTTVISLIGMLIAVPLGLGAAIYLAEYAPDNLVTRTIRLAIINLAGIPSVVYGLFGLGLFVLFLQLGTSIVAGSLTLAGLTNAIPSDLRAIDGGFLAQSPDAEADDLLASCYRTALHLANENGIASIAFPSLSTGAFGFPMEEAARVAMGAVLAELRRPARVSLVRFVLFDDVARRLHQDVLDALTGR